jgi:hypothetical protein
MKIFGSAMATKKNILETNNWFDRCYDFLKYFRRTSENSPNPVTLNGAFRGTQFNGSSQVATDIEVGSTRFFSRINLKFKFFCCTSTTHSSRVTRCIDVMITFFAVTSSSLSKKRQFSLNFSAKIF